MLGDAGFSPSEQVDEQEEEQVDDVSDDQSDDVSDKESEEQAADLIDIMADVVSESGEGEVSAVEDLIDLTTVDMSEAIEFS